MTLMRTIPWNGEGRNGSRVGGEAPSLGSHSLAAQLVCLMLWAGGVFCMLCRESTGNPPAGILIWAFWEVTSTPSAARTEGIR